MRRWGRLSALGTLVAVCTAMGCGAWSDPAEAGKRSSPTIPHSASPDLSWPDQPEELGRVRWMRGFEQAKAQAQATGKPLLVLFDEVPGCSTVLAYGNGTLSDPLVVDAIEESFVPVVVYNNVAGPDRKVLNAYGEPTWNNPVVRILDAKGDDVVPRLAGDYRSSTLLSRMVTALQRGNHAIPDWLALVEREARTEGQTETALYSMYCFWSGEEHLGANEGVLSTTPGFAGGREVVEVVYDPKTTSRATLDAYAARGNATPLDASFRASAKDDRYRIRRTTWAAVPMTPAQASRVNAAVGAGEDPSRWLSPRQRALHERAKVSGQATSAGLGREDLRRAFDKAIR
ncbi:MAG: VPGUxxT family thioredoxin-like (seleno)protein, type 2 [Myxococcota bacterium]